MYFHSYTHAKSELAFNQDDLPAIHDPALRGWLKHFLNVADGGKQVAYHNDGHRCRYCNSSDVVKNLRGGWECCGCGAPR